VAGLTALLVAVQLSGSAYLTNLLVVTALFALPAVGLALLMGYTGQISLGHAAFVGLGAYASSILVKSTGWSPWAGVAIGIGCAGLAAWAIGWLVFRLRGHHLAMATLAFGIIFHVAAVELRPLTGGQDGISGVPPLNLFGLRMATDAAILPFAWIACIIGIVLARNLVHSPAGYAMRTVAESEAVAASLGIAPDRIKRRVMALSGAYAGAGGALYAHYLGYISPGPFDIGFSIKLLLIVALGGFSGTWSVLFGVLFVVLTSELLKPFGRYDVILFGTLLVIVMIWCPGGLLDGLARLWRRLARASRPVAG
jgi:branched-chain amino acid transport system permease protein